MEGGLGPSDWPSETPVVSSQPQNAHGIDPILLYYSIKSEIIKLGYFLLYTFLQQLRVLKDSIS